MNSVTTVSSSFPVKDITHKPKRTQAGNLSSLATAPTETGEVYYNNTNPVSLLGVPKTVTIERAISFYESNATDEYRVLFIQTAKWLREYMSKSAPTKEGKDNETDV